jgi:hypothetical protein
VRGSGGARSGPVWTHCGGLFMVVLVDDVGRVGDAGMKPFATVNDALRLARICVAKHDADGPENQDRRPEASPPPDQTGMKQNDPAYYCDNENDDSRPPVRRRLPHSEPIATDVFYPSHVPYPLTQVTLVTTVKIYFY